MKPLLNLVRKILLTDWSPISFEVPEDEYDQYALRIIGMLYRKIPLI